MKRFSSLLLALCLLVSSPALADKLTEAGTANTTVSFAVTGKGFLVTIPASVSIDSASGVGSMTVSLNTKNYKPYSDMVVTIELTGAANYKNGQLYLSDGTDTIPYTIAKGTTNIRPSSASSEYTVLSWTTTSVVTRTPTATLTLKADPTAITTATAGSYGDTLTFTVRAKEDSSGDLPIL